MTDGKSSYITLETSWLRQTLDAINHEKYIIAEKIGVDPSTISRWLRGSEARISRKYYDRLNELLVGESRQSAHGLIGDSEIAENQHKKTSPAATV